MLALLFAQWLGLAHRIDHAGLAQPAQAAQSVRLAQAGQSALQTNTDYDKSLDHSCALFDASALAAALNSPPVSLAIVPGAQVLALWVAFASWDAPFLRYFSSRAPPLA